MRGRLDSAYGIVSVCSKKMLVLPGKNAPQSTLIKFGLIVEGRKCVLNISYSRKAFRELPGLMDAI